MNHGNRIKKQQTK